MWRPCLFLDSCWSVGGSSITILPLLVQIIWTSATLANPCSVCVCVLVNTLQCHDSVNFVQDSATENPQLVAERGVGRNHGKTMGKNLMRTQQVGPRFGQDPSGERLYLSMTEEGQTGDMK